MLNRKNAAESGFKHTVKLFKGEENIVEATEGVFNDCKGYANQYHDRPDSFDSYDDDEDDE